MSEAIPGPALVVVTGYPASGKTSLARQLGRRLGLPVISKDDIKEPLGEVLGAGDPAWSHQLGQATYAVMFAVLDAVLHARQAVIVEANFEAEPAGNRLRGLIAKHAARAMRVVMIADVDVLLERWRDRAAAGERHPVHLDAENEPRLAAMVRKPYQPPDLPGPLVEVDGNRLESVDPDRVAAAVRAALGAAEGIE